MDFLGIGVPEVIVIIILALIFIGPRDLPKLAGRFAKFLRDLRMMSEGFRTEWQREMQAATRIEGLKELREELIATRDTLREAGHDIQEAMTIDLEALEAEGAKEAAAAEEAATAGQAAAAGQVAAAGQAATNDDDDEIDDDSDDDSTPVEAAKVVVDEPVTVEESPTKTNGSVAETPATPPDQSAGPNNDPLNLPHSAKPAKAAPTPEAQPPGLPAALQIDLEEFETRSIQPPVTDNSASDNTPLEAKDSD